MIGDALEEVRLVRCDSQMMQLDLVLPLRDPEGLKAFLEELYDPNSGIYHEFLTPKEFTDRFGPTQAEYDEVLKFAKQNRLTVVGGTSALAPVTVGCPSATLPG